MIVLGIDPGTATTGFGVVDYTDGRLRHIDVGVLITQPTELLPDRLLSIHTDIHTLIDRYKPDTVATEKLFFHSNVTNAISVGGAVGVILLAFAQRFFRKAAFGKIISAHSQARSSGYRNSCDGPEH